jgi:hypothetical protein
LERRIGAGQPPAWPLHGEAELMQEPRHVVVVVPDRKALRDEVADHRPGPDAAGLSGPGRPGLDERGQLVALDRGQLGCRAGRFPCSQSGHAQGLVPLEPPVHRAAGHVELRRHVDDAPTRDLSEHSPGSTPDIEVVSATGLVEKPLQRLSRNCSAAGWADRLAVLATSPDHLQSE